MRRFMVHGTKKGTKRKKAKKRGNNTRRVRKKKTVVKLALLNIAKVMHAEGFGCNRGRQTFLFLVHHNRAVDISDNCFQKSREHTVKLAFNNAAVCIYL